MAPKNKKIADSQSDAASPGEKKKKYESCSCCDEDICSGLLQCKACHAFFYHAACMNISDKSYSALKPLLTEISWVCNICIFEKEQEDLSLKEEVKNVRFGVKKCKKVSHFSSPQLLQIH